MQVSISGPRRHTAVARATLALCALLGTTGVLAQNTDNSDPNSPTLSEVQVRETSGSSGYQGAQRNTAATRTDTPLLETPQAVRVVPQQLIEDLGARRLADTVDFVSGITRLNDFGGTWDNSPFAASATPMGAACSTALRRAGAMARSATWPRSSGWNFSKAPPLPCMAAASQAAPSMW